ncbi:MAG: site-2 protease family protein [Thermoanaerobaculia bacterium]
MPDSYQTPELSLLPGPDPARESEPLGTKKLPVKGKQFRLAVLLFLCTLFTCITVGGAFLLGARTDVVTDLVPFLLPGTVVRVWTDPALLLWGLAYALPVLAILLAHELGHYLACRWYGLPASPPYFLPSPFLLGTFGAFIRIRRVIRNKRELFDVGVAGPIAGFLVLLPILVYGVAHSIPTSIVLAPESPEAMFLTLPGDSLLYRALVFFFHGNLRAGEILNPHPFVFAAWVGSFATMLNLLPLAQLDGGHILYAVAGRLQGRIAPILFGLLVAGGFLWPGWFFWAAIVLWLGLRHPPVVDEDQPLDRKRRWLAVAALAIFLLCFMPVPISSIAIGVP